MNVILLSGGSGKRLLLEMYPNIKIEELIKVKKPEMDNISILDLQISI